LDGLATCLRPCIRAPKGKKLVVADLNAIEVRVLMWLSGCNEGLQVFKDGLCPYKDFATEFYGIGYDTVTKVQRNICKPPVLGCGYGLGPGQEREMQNGQKTKTGLWAYAASMGVQLTQTDTKRMVSLYRGKYSEVVYYWNYLEDAFLAAYKTKKRQQVGAIYFEATPEAVKILLPSGRYIHYLNPHAYKGAEGVKISFDGLRMGGWGRQSTWGGRLTENVVQAVARDVLAEGMLRAEAAGLTIVGHVHDELIVETKPMGIRPLEFLEAAMSDPIDWAPGLPLAAEGAEMEFYAK
jgi:DNA polymerase